MTNREINSLIAEKVMGWTQSGPAFKPGEFHIVHDGSVLISTDGGKMQFFNPAESPADAMAVWKRCHESGENLESWKSDTTWLVACTTRRHGVWAEAPTLETAICQFAVRLFQ